MSVCVCVLGLMMFDFEGSLRVWQIAWMFEVSVCVLGLMMFEVSVCVCWD